MIESLVVLMHRLQLSPTFYTEVIAFHNSILLRTGTTEAYSFGSIHFHDGLMDFQIPYDVEDLGSIEEAVHGFNAGVVQLHIRPFQFIFGKDVPLDENNLRSLRSLLVASAGK